MTNEDWIAAATGGQRSFSSSVIRPESAPDDPAPVELPETETRPAESTEPPASTTSEAAPVESAIDQVATDRTATAEPAPGPVEDALFAGPPAPQIDPDQIGPTGRPLRAVPDPRPLTSHGPARVIAMCNQKGGVGKTTSTINLGAALAEYGRKVLLVDLDPQGALSAGLGVPSHELDRTVYNLMLERNTTVTDVLVPTRVPGVDLIPANIDLSAAEVQLVNEVGREHALSRALAPVLPDYDIVLIDCQPSLGLLTVNALAASDYVVIPMQAEYFALRGVALLTNTIDKVVARVNPKVSVLGVLVTMYNKGTLHSREVLERVRSAFGDKVFQTVIAKTIKFADSVVAHEPITEYAPDSPGAESYRQLAREVIARMD